MYYSPRRAQYLRHNIGRIIDPTELKQYTTLCADGSYSRSKAPQACVYHGGVQERNVPPPGRTMMVATPQLDAPPGRRQPGAAWEDTVCASALPKPGGGIQRGNGAADHRSRRNRQFPVRGVRPGAVVA